MTKMLIMGPPGSGKGTQAERLAKQLGVVPISTGDIFRAHVQAGTPLGTKAKAFLDAGDFVPDDITNLMVRDRLQEPDAEDGFILDGYPRTAAQVGYLDEILATRCRALDVVLQLLVHEEELVRRLLARAQQLGRKDDTETVIRHRLNLYNEQTRKIAAIYADLGVLVVVDGVGEADAITESLLSAIRNRGPGRKERLNIPLAATKPAPLAGIRSVTATAPSCNPCPG